MTGVLGIMATRASRWVIRAYLARHAAMFELLAVVDASVEEGRDDVAGMQVGHQQSPDGLAREARQPPASMPARPPHLGPRLRGLALRLRLMRPRARAKVAFANTVTFLTPKYFSNSASRDLTNGPELDNMREDHIPSKYGKNSSSGGRKGLVTFIFFIISNFSL